VEEEDEEDEEEEEGRVEGLLPPLPVTAWRTG